MYTSILSCVGIIAVGVMVATQSPTQASAHDADAIVGGACCNGVNPVNCPVNMASPATYPCLITRDWCGAGGGIKHCWPAQPTTQDVCQINDPDCLPYGNDRCAGSCGPEW